MSKHSVIIELDIPEGNAEAMDYDDAHAWLDSFILDIKTDHYEYNRDMIAHLDKIYYMDKV